MWQSPPLRTDIWLKRLKLQKVTAEPPCTSVLPRYILQSGSCRHRAKATELPTPQASDDDLDKFPDLHLSFGNATCLAK